MNADVIGAHFHINHWRIIIFAYLDERIIMYAYFYKYMYINQLLTITAELFQTMTMFLMFFVIQAIPNTNINILKIKIMKF